MRSRRVLVTALAATVLAVGSTGCAPTDVRDTGAIDGTADSTQNSMRTTPPPATASAQPSDRPTPMRRPTGTATATHTGDPSARPTATEPPTTDRPTADATATYTPPIICPHVVALDPDFEVEALGIDPDTAMPRVKVTMTYTNPVEYPLYLLGSIGYVDSEGYESDLYSIVPGGMVFDDVRLLPGEGTLTRELEDVWGEATESMIYFTAWTMAGTPLDSPEPAPCETNRGYTNH